MIRIILLSQRPSILKNIKCSAMPWSADHANCIRLEIYYLSCYVLRDVDLIELVETCGH